jgi:hypothetical protein
MMTSRNKFSRNVLKVGMTALGISCLGAAVFAAPLSITPRSKLVASMQEKTALQPLSRGVAITLAKADDGESEDCVRVTKMTGPDGQIYPTRGIVCR